MEESTNRKKNSIKILLTALGTLLLLVGVAAGVYLVRQNQDIREKAAVPTPTIPTSPELTVSSCSLLTFNLPALETPTPTAGPTTAPTATPSPSPSSSPSPSPTNAPTASPSPSPVPTAGPTTAPTATPTNAPTAAPTATATSTAIAQAPTATATATSVAIAQSQPTQAPSLPDAGTSWPTIAASALGILVIFGAILLAL